VDVTGYLNVLDVGTGDGKRLYLFVPYLQHLRFGTPLYVSASYHLLCSQYPGGVAQGETQEGVDRGKPSRYPPVLLDRMKGAGIEETAKAIYSPGVNIYTSGTYPTQRHPAAGGLIRMVDHATDRLSKTCGRELDPLQRR
jgi:hypothetical protein